MKKLLLSVLAGIAVSVFSAGVAHATVINFNDLEQAGTGYQDMSTYSNSGFTFTSSVGASSIAFASAQQSAPFYFGSANLLNNLDGQVTALAFVDGAFTVNSMDVHGLYDKGQALDFYAYSGSSQVGHLSYVIPDLNWETVNFGSDFQNITSLQWAQNSPYHAFDNIVLNGGSPTNAVPEPATMALLGSGLVGMFFRRKNRA
ncbi:MAG: PEP-CTERM sorting domain-containing protein [Candidatus Omnitrophica bacterium]|nr:PEP-CTERM sorting domain-containing protein [Candidatus Omnitrophota bacterium]